MNRACTLLFLALLTCTKGERAANVPKDSIQGPAPEPAPLSAPDSLSTGEPLDEIPSLLAGLDSEAATARLQARAVAATPKADSVFLSFRDRFLRSEEHTSELQ